MPREIGTFDLRGSVSARLAGTIAVNVTQVMVSSKSVETGVCTAIGDDLIQCGRDLLTAQSCVGMKRQALTCLLIDDSRQEVSGFQGINDRPAFVLIAPDLEGAKCSFMLEIHWIRARHSAVS